MDTKLSKKDMVKFKRLTSDIMKKASELSILYGVPVCVIIDGPDKDAPDVFPQNFEEFKSIFNRYRNTRKGEPCQNSVLSHSRSSKKTNLGVVTIGANLTVEGRTASCVKDLIKQLSPDQLIALVGRLEAKLEAVNARIAMLKKSEKPAQVEKVPFEEPGMMKSMLLPDLNLSPDEDYFTLE